MNVNEPIYKTAQEMFEQLEYCQYEAIGGPLEMNTAYIQLKRYIAKLKAELDLAIRARDHFGSLWDDLRETTRWIPVSERLPLSGQRVLVWMPNDCYTFTYLAGDHCWGNDRGYVFAFEAVEYWRPLPPPPSSGGKEVNDGKEVV